MRGKAYRDPPPAQTRLQNPELTAPKYTKFLSDVEGSPTVLMRASCCYPPTRCGMPAHKMKVGADWRLKSVTIAASLERSRKEGDHAHPHVYLS